MDALTHGVDTDIDRRVRLTPAANSLDASLFRRQAL
jgi:hypothetical protein